jgi:hypothetical protein
VVHTVNNLAHAFSKHKPHAWTALKLSVRRGVVILGFGPAELLLYISMPARRSQLCAYRSIKRCECIENNEKPTVCDCKPRSFNQTVGGREDVRRVAVWGMYPTPSLWDDSRHSKLRLPCSASLPASLTVPSSYQEGSFGRVSDTL